MDQINFKAVIDKLSGTTYKPLPEHVQIRVPDAREHIKDGLTYFCGDSAKWLSDYDKIAEWLSDNRGKGLMLVGECGVGKSLIGMRIIPLILNYYCRKIVTVCTASDLNKNPDDVIKTHIIYIDDVGTEDISNIYGNKRIPFAELVDSVERDGKLLMFSTNLDDTHLAEKYGDRVIDRLHAVTRKITIHGKSFRR
jgi:DNA replication protein DnaC